VARLIETRHRGRVELRAKRDDEEIAGQGPSGYESGYLPGAGRTLEIRAGQAAHGGGLTEGEYKMKRQELIKEP
jgi:hypothetical protein